MFLFFKSTKRPTRSLNSIHAAHGFARFNCPHFICRVFFLSTLLVGFFCTCFEHNLMPVLQSIPLKAVCVRVYFIEICLHPFYYVFIEKCVFACINNTQQKEMAKATVPFIRSMYAVGCMKHHERGFCFELGNWNFSDCEKI